MTDADIDAEMAGAWGRHRKIEARRAALIALGEAFVDFGDEDKCPAHDCDFVNRPDQGHCRFHDKWFAALAAYRALEAE
jgi:hypothetical protein